MDIKVTNQISTTDTAVKYRLFYKKHHMYVLEVSREKGEKLLSSNRASKEVFWTEILGNKYS